MCVKMKKLMLSSVLMLLFVLGYAEPLKKELNNNWEFRQSRGVNWYPAKIPGVVHLDLMENGIIEDPFYRLNERACQWVDKEDWEYRTTFDVPEEMFIKDSIRLFFEGLDTYADVYLNDKLILKANNMFREWPLDVKKILKKKENTLRVYFHSPVKIDLPKFEKSDYKYPAVNDQSENGAIFDKKVSVYARKAGYHYGWDWGPRLVTSGIWRPVYIEAWNNMRLEDVRVITEKISSKVANLKSVLEIISSMDQEVEITIQNTENSQVYKTQAANLKVGQNIVEIPFNISKPSLWWPNGMGDQPLYSINYIVKSKSAAEGSVNKVVRTGIRSISLVTEMPDGKKTFHFNVNNTPVFMKGANYIPSDNFLPRVDSLKYERVVSDARKGNMNMLRVWGGGIYENDIFYDLCDKYGILVWQDFMFACSMYPADEGMLENIRQEAVQNVKRLRNHASMALWCGNNEVYDAWNGWGWKPAAESLSKTIADKVWSEYLNIFHKLLPEVVNEYDPSTAYWKSSPMIENGSGDMHYWGVWHAQEPVSKYKETIPQFMSEYGFQSFPEFGSVQIYAPEQGDWNILSEVMLLHQRNNRGNQLINNYLNMEYRKPKDFRSFLYMSHILQADAIKTGAEAHRRNMPDCMGSLYWQLNDCWPVASWSGTDFYGRWKALHYYIGRAFSEILVSPVEENGRLNVYAVSDKLTASKATLKKTVYDLDGKVVSDISRPITIKPNSSTSVFSEPVETILKGKARNEVVVFTSLANKNDLLSTNTAYLAKAMDIDFRDIKFTKTISKVEGGYEVSLEVDKPARGVYLELDNIDNFFSDNYFDLMPGQASRIKVNSKLSLAEFEKQLTIRTLRDSYITN